MTFPTDKLTKTMNKCPKCGHESPAKNQANGRKFIYFAAHAPEIPSWFARKEWEEEMTVMVNPYRMTKQPIKRAETRMQHMVRWRIEYAKAMVDSLANAEMIHTRKPEEKP